MSLLMRHWWFHIGFDTQEMAVKGKSSFKFVLSEDSQALDEVVVIGYGTQNRQAITGSIAKAKLETYSIVPTNNVLETIKGSMPGLNVGGTNTAGGTPSFSIRGQNSTRNSAEDNGNQPLVVLMALSIMDHWQISLLTISNRLRY